MFGLFKKKKDKAHVLGAPAKGKAVPLSKKSAIRHSVRGCWETELRRSFRPKAKFMRRQTEPSELVFDTLHAIQPDDGLKVRRFWSMWDWIRYKLGGDGFDRSCTSRRCREEGRSASGR